MSETLKISSAGTRNTQHDVVPCESYPLENSVPQNLYTLVRLFGLDPPDYRSCKVLELGCASSGKLIPLADM